jgi:hypothetical protein
MPEVREVEPGGRRVLNDDGNPLVHLTTCGTCGQTWDDALVTSRTPVPSGRCPFEVEHEDIIARRLEELRVVLRSESMSWGELHELQSLADYIEPGDVELLEAAGVDEESIGTLGTWDPLA